VAVRLFVLCNTIEQESEGPVRIFIVSSLGPLIVGLFLIHGEYCFAQTPQNQKFEELSWLKNIKACGAAPPQGTRYEARVTQVVAGHFLKRVEPILQTPDSPVRTNADGRKKKGCELATKNFDLKYEGTFKTELAKRGPVHPALADLVGSDYDPDQEELCVSLMSDPGGASEHHLRFARTLFYDDQDQEVLRCERGEGDRLGVTYFVKGKVANRRQYQKCLKAIDAQYSRCSGKSQGKTGVHGSKTATQVKE
jgi:hypothetical protein